MSKLCKQLIAIFTMVLISNTMAFADGQLQLHHQVVDSQQNGAYQTVSFRLTIDNLSSQDLHRVRLLPSGSEFSSLTQDNLINIGNLPAMGQAVIEWTANTPVAVEYFQSGMPVFFIKAKQEHGELIELPVYSHGEILP